MLLFFGMMGWMVHQVPFYESEGMSRGTAALIVSISAGAQHRSHGSAMGLLAARFERFEGAVIGAPRLMFMSMGTLLISTSPPAIALFIFFWVIGASAGPMVESLVLIKAFGMRHFGSSWAPAWSSRLSVRLSVRRWPARSTTAPAPTTAPSSCSCRPSQRAWSYSRLPPECAPRPQRRRRWKSESP